VAADLATAEALAWQRLGAHKTDQLETDEPGMGVRTTTPTTRSMFPTFIGATLSTPANRCNANHTLIARVDASHGTGKRWLSRNE
jgi:hypothetical protein